jgi:gamma-glutamylcyclotransferase (GGCT)/AIG2-like uncharacterized protein YtfP
MSRHALFAYGTLLVPEVFYGVVGRQIDGQAARLAGHARFRLRGRVYPAIVAHPTQQVLGALYPDLGADELQRLDDYEGDLYERRAVSVLVGRLLLPAQAYVLAPAEAGELSADEWDLEQFRREHLASYLARIGPG